MPINANTAFRELGIIFFLACVGLKSGGHFLETLTHGDGLWWMALASLITILPLLLVPPAAASACCCSRPALRRRPR